LEVLVWVQIAGRQGKPQPNDQEEKVCAAPHVDLDFFLEIPAQASARPYRGFQGGVLDRGQAGCIRHVGEGRRRGKSEGSGGVATAVLEMSELWIV
jgi:hypothetical protein